MKVHIAAAVLPAQIPGGCARSDKILVYGPRVDNRGRQTG